MMIIEVAVGNATRSYAEAFVWTARESTFAAYVLRRVAASS